MQSWIPSLRGRALPGCGHSLRCASRRSQSCPSFNCPTCSAELAHHAGGRDRRVRALHCLRHFREAKGRARTLTPSNRASVVICAYTLDRWESLTRAVRSVEAQRAPPAEVIVVIDHNPELLDRARNELSGCLLVENSESRGLSGARNSGIAGGTRRDRGLHGRRRRGGSRVVEGPGGCLLGCVCGWCWRHDLAAMGGRPADMVPAGLRLGDRVYLPRDIPPRRPRSGMCWVAIWRSDAPS